MIDCSKVSQSSFLGWAMRLPLRLVPRHWAVPILQGPVKGMRWIVESGTHGCWLGTYEQVQAYRFAQEIRPGMVVFDVGAHAGFYLLLASPRVGEDGLVVAFEPNPVNLQFLKKHIRINDLGNVALFEGAVSDRSTVALFDSSDGTSTGHLSPLGSMTVTTVSLDEWINDGRSAPPDVIKIDVEGAEKMVLYGAENILRTKRPLIFLATHSPELHAECIGILRNFGYQIELLQGHDDEIIGFHE
jgi:FkbM family methyltransferase